MPRFAPAFPLVASICGGGSSGKSTLFNALIQKNISPSGGTAGINRRILIGGSSERYGQDDRFAGLFEPFGYKQDCSDCTEQGADGRLDLTLKFKTQEIVAALGDAEDGDCLALTLIGSLFDGTLIAGQDVVLIKQKGKK